MVDWGSVTKPISPRPYIVPKEMVHFSTPLNLSWPCNLTWPTESVKKDIVGVPGLELLFIENPAYKIGTWLASGNLDFRRDSSKRGSLCLSCLHKQYSLC